MAHKEVFPEHFVRALDYAAEHGEKLVVFATQEECTRERLKFYRFRAAIRENVEHPLHEVEKRCTVQWIAIPPTKYKRGLKILVSAAIGETAWDAPVDEETAKNLAVEEWLRSNRQKG